MTTGERIKKNREHRGMTQAELAERTGLSRQTISNIEVGRFDPRSRTVRRIAAGLECEAGDLIGEENES